MAACGRSANRIRREVFNALNRANFDLPNRIFGTPNFGRIFSAKNPRAKCRSESSWPSSPTRFRPNSGTTLHNAREHVSGMSLRFRRLPGAGGARRAHRASPMMARPAALLKRRSSSSTGGSVSRCRSFSCSGSSPDRDDVLELSRRSARSTGCSARHARSRGVKVSARAARAAAWSARA